MAEQARQGAAPEDSLSAPAALRWDIMRAPLALWPPASCLSHSYRPIKPLAAARRYLQREDVGIDPARIVEIEARPWPDTLTQASTFPPR
jgi:hypothetical protein